MDVDGLFKGVAVVIDDEVHSADPKITNILKQVNDKNIPLMKYDSIPSEGVISHFQELSFVFLDWRLIKQNITDNDFASGVSVPAALQDHEVDENIDFIKKLKEVCFCPVFIFTNEGVDTVIDVLEEKGLYDRNKPNHIFIKQKSEIQGKTKLFREVEKWIKNNPSVYVLKEWEREYQKSKNKLFSEFEQLSPVWPKIMWKNFTDDGGNSSLDLGELISRNLHTRMAPFEFSDEILSKRGKKIERSEIRRVLEGAMYLANSNLHDDNINPGDVFKLSGKYYINIRAACDCVPDRSANGSTLDDVQLYLLKGSKLTDPKAKKIFRTRYGQFLEIDSQSILFPLHDGKSIDFRFKDLVIRSWKDIKDKRIGRILPPYINRIQQRYALYLQRQGLPRIPDSALFGK